MGALEIWWGQYPRRRNKPEFLKDPARQHTWVQLSAGFLILEATTSEVGQHAAEAKSYKGDLFLSEFLFFIFLAAAAIYNERESGKPADPPG